MAGRDLGLAARSGSRVESSAGAAGPQASAGADFGADERDRVAAPGRHALDEANALLPEGRAVIRTGNPGGYPAGGQRTRMGRALRGGRVPSTPPRVRRSGDACSATTCVMCRQRQTGARLLKRTMRSAVRAGKVIRGRHGEPARR